MPSIALSLGESALHDLEKIKAWYTEQGVPEVGERLVAEIFQRIETLTDQPDIGRVVPEFDLAFLRELIHAPFQIVYRRDKARVRIIRIWRSERLFHISR